jgi:TonB family protein
MVGLNVNGELSTFVLPDKEVNEKNFIAYGCENLASGSDSEKCTRDYIIGFIGKHYKAAKKKNYKSGRMVLNVIIGKDGEVEKVKLIETIADAELQEFEAMRVIKLLPKFIPAQFDDGRPVRSSINIPINF